MTEDPLDDEVPAVADHDEDEPVVVPLLVDADVLLLEEVEARAVVEVVDEVAEAERETTA